VGSALVCANALLLGAGCVSASKTPPSAPVTVATKVRTDVAAMGRVVTLPRPALSAVWQEQQIGDGNMGPTDTRLLAVVQFSAKDAKQIEVTARKQSPRPKEELEVLPWFPASVRKVAHPNAGGRLVLLVEKLNVSQFAHLSLSNGFVARVPKTAFFVLSLYSM
jgi:hypothetical protein